MMHTYPQEVTGYRQQATGSASRGVTLIDTLVGSALMLIIFLGIAGAVQLSIDVVSNNKARAGALALASERIEYLRSIPYTALGTTGGVPSGSLDQTEELTINGIDFTRRTIIQYADDPSDSSGASDLTGAADYKAVTIEVAWRAENGDRSISLVSRFEPSTGLESAISGGTLLISVRDAANLPLQGARVDISNASASPAVQLTTFTNSSGVVSLIDVPVASGYAVTVSKSGYSSAGTHVSSVANPNPVPGVLTVTKNQTTSSTFSIDLLSSFTIRTLFYGSGAPITSAAISLRGAKTIGSSPVVYAYSAVVGGTGSATTTVQDLEWDTYTMSIAADTGYDLASSCAPQPVVLTPGTSPTVTLYLAPHTASSLPVKVAASSNGALVAGAAVRLSAAGYDVTQMTDACGQTFFSNLAPGAYTLSVSGSGYTTFSTEDVTVGTTTAVYAVSLN